MSQNTENDLKEEVLQETEDTVETETAETAASAEAAETAETTDGPEQAAEEPEAEFSLEDYMKQYQELEEARAKLQEEKEQLDARFLRLQADFDNFRRRSRADNEEASRRAAAAVAEGLLPVLDNFERALAAMEDGADRQGVELIMKQLQTALGNSGLAEIEAQDQDFDPNLHHAVSQVDAGEEGRNKVIMVLQKGYTFNGKLLRAAMVQVGQ
ncbi:MAG: nucleotide exchange factor GrpE [Firmicutes bacterium]|nr:nucleotide exchange factor GrpE [Bacillota bacterium]